MTSKRVVPSHRAWLSLIFAVGLLAAPACRAMTADDCKVALVKDYYEYSLQKGYTDTFLLSITREQWESYIAKNSSQFTLLYQDLGIGTQSDYDTMVQARNAYFAHEANTVTDDMAKHIIWRAVSPNGYEAFNKCLAAVDQGLTYKLAVPNEKRPDHLTLLVEWHSDVVNSMSVKALVTGGVFMKDGKSTHDTALNSARPVSPSTPWLLEIAESSGAAVTAVTLVPESGAAETVEVDRADADIGVVYPGGADTQIATLSLSMNAAGSEWTSQDTCRNDDGYWDKAVMNNGHCRGWPALTAQLKDPTYHFANLQVQPCQPVRGDDGCSTYEAEKDTSIVNPLDNTRLSLQGYNWGSPVFQSATVEIHRRVNAATCGQIPPEPVVNGEQVVLHVPNECRANAYVAWTERTPIAGSADERLFATAAGDWPKDVPVSLVHGETGPAEAHTTFIWHTP